MLLRATETFLAFTPAGQHFIAKGTIVDSSDPLVAHRADLFTPVEPTYSSAPVVEQATAAPGEQRAAAPRKARAAKKAAPVTPAED